MSRRFRWAVVRAPPIPSRRLALKLEGESEEATLEGPAFELLDAISAPAKDFNEDAYGFVDNFAWVLDGASPTDRDKDNDSSVTAYAQSLNAALYTVARSLHAQSAPRIIRTALKDLIPPGEK